MMVPLILVWLIASRGRHLLGARSATFLACLLFLYFVLRIPATGFVISAVGLLASLLALRLAAEKEPRHHLQICALSLFLLSASSLYTLSPLFLPALASLLFLVTLILMLLAVAHHDPELPLDRTSIKRILLSALTMELAALPLMVVLFLILPRTQYPLWRFGPPANTAVIGFSETVRPGSAARIEAERVPVFRVEMERGPEELLYWRGIVLNTPEGSAWVRSEPPPASRSQVSRGSSVRQVVYLEPSQTPYLFGLDVPYSWGRVRSQSSYDSVARMQSAPGKRMQYEVYSFSGRNLASRESDIDFYRHLPSPISPRLADLADGVKRDAQGEEDRLELLERRFRQLNLVYDVKGLPVTADPLDSFLFEGKRGNCEFFAASYALLLRRAGFPSRIVGGYYGGEYNEMGRYYLVTRDLAHTWVEVYRGGEGWQRIDPSAWGASFLERTRGRERTLASRARIYLDALAHLWQSKVVPFDLDRQVEGARAVADIMRRAGHLSLRWWLAGAVAIMVLVSVFLARGRLRRIWPRNVGERLLLKLERRLRQQDPTLPTIASCGLYRFAELSGKEEARRFAERYGEVVYRDRCFTREDLSFLKRLLRSI
jgi:transglutaminase-like putative cysteine protease